MKVATPSADLQRAVKSVLERVPTLQVDSRPESLKSAAQSLAKSGVAGADLVAKADVSALQTARLDALKDIFEAGKTASSTATGAAGKTEKPTALVSGGSMSGMLAAVALAKSGQKVVIVEPRPQHTRDIRFGCRQGMIDTLCMLDPKLALEFTQKASKIESIKTLEAAGGTMAGNVDSFDPQGHVPDAEQVPDSGAELMQSTSTYVMVAREFETMVEDYVKKNFAGQIEFVEGKLHPEKQPDGNVKWQLEKPGATKTDPPVISDFLHGVKPSAVFVAEGAGSTTRTALGITTAATTPVQWWTAGIIHTTDKTVKTPGQATIRELYDEQQVKNADGTTRRQEQRAVAISDGVKGTWVLTEMPPGFDANPTHPQNEINDYYFKRASLVTGASEDDLRKAGATGPIGFAGSQPTAFPLQGKAASAASQVLPDGTIVALMGDAVQTSTFQAGGGMNTAVTEVLAVMTMMEDLQSGVSPNVAASRYEQSAFERGGAWSAAGIEYFYPSMPQSQVQELVKAELQAIADWRKAGATGPSPLERLQTILAQSKVATEPVGMKLAA
jgi:2-polyprenyl-6-methoxyphenol hydroxylase-like FAD-dependent oxidoreductase